jgi:hypothetical protein
MGFGAWYKEEGQSVPLLTLDWVREEPITQVGGSANPSSMPMVQLISGLEFGTAVRLHPPQRHARGSAAEVQVAAMLFC